MSAFGENASCHLQSQAFSGERIGVERSGGGPGNTTHLPRRQLRNLYFGTLGPQALSVTYASSSGRGAQQVAPGVGAYLIVLPTRAHDQLATGGGSIGSAGGIGPVAPLATIAYRLRGVECRRVQPGRPAVGAACPLPQSLYPHEPRAKPKPLHRPLRVSLRTAHHVLVAARVVFTAPFAVGGAAQSYEIRIPVSDCRARSAGTGYTSMATDRDLAAGATVTQSIGYPFANNCGRRTARIEVFYQSAGSPPVEVGSVQLLQPAGTLASPPGRPGRRLRHAHRGRRN